MDNTPRLLLQKPNPNPITGDFLDVAVLNANFDKIDGALGAQPVTSATRPASPYDGKFIRETDTKRYYVRNNTQAVWDQIALSSAAVKTANESLPNSIVLQDDDHLSIPVDANATYLMDGDIIYYSAVAVDLTAGWSAPAGATMEWSTWTPSEAHTGTPSYEGVVKFESRNITQTQNWGGTGTIVHAMPRGCLQTVSAGTFRFRWSQRVANADASIVYAKSWLRIQRVS